MKISFRQTTEADLDFVLDAEQNPENRAFVSVWTRDQHRAALKAKDLSHLVIENHEGNRVGYIILAGLTDPNKNVEFRRIVITEKNRGYGKTALQEIKRIAFEELRAHRLWLDVKEANIRARHIYETEGFITEGVLRECLKTANGFESLVLMSMLRNEYESEFRRKQPKIRIAAPQDAEAIHKVLAESFAEYEMLYTPQGFAATVPTVDEIKRRFGGETIWVALINERIVGTVAVVPNEKSLYIRSMAVVPNARGNQIGERLLSEIEFYAAAHNCQKLFLNTMPFLSRAIRLYEKFGFVRCGTDDLFGTPLLTMGKYLKSKIGQAEES